MRCIGPIPRAVGGLLLATLCGTPVQAEVSVEGPAEAVRLQARDASVEEILAALRARFNLRYRGAAAGGLITMKYEGPLRRVLTRVLDGNSYVIEPSGSGIEVILLTNGVPGPASPSPAVRRRED